MKKKSHKLAITFIIIILLLLVVIAGLPTFISSTRGKEFALRQINQRIPGELMVGSWSLRWLGNMHIERLSFNDQQGVRLFDLSKASISRGLFNLIADHNDLGDIKLIKPLLSVSPSVQSPIVNKGSGAPATASKATSKPHPQKTTSSPKAKQTTNKEFSLPAIRGTVAIEDGGLQLLSPDGTQQPVLENLAVELTIDGPDKPISFKLNGIAGAPGSMCAGVGTLTLPTDGVLDVNEVAIDVKLKVKDLDLNPISRIVAEFSASPLLGGELNTDVSITGSLAKGLDITTDLAVTALKVPEKKAAFGDIKVELSGKATKTSMDIRQAVIQSKFCNINASGNYGMAGAGTISAKADMDIATTLDFLKNMGVVTNDISCAGNLQAVLTGNSQGEFLTVSQADIKVSALNLKYQKKTFRQDVVTFATSANINTATRQFDSPGATVTTSFGSATLQAITIGDWSKLPESLKATVKTDLDIKLMRTALSDFVTLPANWGVSGRLKTDLELDFSKPAVYRINLGASIPKLNVQSAAPSLVIDDNPALSLALSATPALDAVNVTKASLNSVVADMNLTAKFRNKEGAGSFALDGLLAPNLTEFSRYLAAYSDIPITFSGKKAEPFEFATSWTGEGETLKIASLTGSAGLFADKIDGFGFHIRSLMVPITIADAGIQSQISAKINDGELSLAPHVALLSGSPLLTMPTNTFILKDIKITTEVADELLGLINPVFRGVSTVSGTMSLYMDNFSWPLNQKELLARTFTGKIILNDVKLAANGLLTDLLDLVKVGTRELDIGTTTIDISCIDGKITSSPLHLKVKKYELILDGVVGLDNSLSYHAKVPMTETLVGKSGYKYLEGTSLNIPISGTVQKPILNLHSFQSAVSDLVKQATTKALSGELEKQLRKLFE